MQEEEEEQKEEQASVVAALCLAGEPGVSRASQLSFC
jgi:hypothetical protein